MQRWDLDPLRPTCTEMTLAGHAVDGLVMPESHPNLLVGWGHGTLYWRDLSAPHTPAHHLSMRFNITSVQPHLADGYLSVRGEDAHLSRWQLDLLRRGIAAGQHAHFDVWGGDIAVSCPHPQNSELVAFTVPGVAAVLFVDDLDDGQPYEVRTPAPPDHLFWHDTYPNRLIAWDSERLSLLSFAADQTFSRTIASKLPGTLREVRQHPCDPELLLLIHHGDRLGSFELIRF
ncbi:MAG: hypothetical protein EOO40_02060 [Deltaproteobacteria bacterium]|nr:MAG: hypothetical protein EOO40_02060 [Deltaproteobacteria bacterium]